MPCHVSSLSAILFLAIECLTADYIDEHFMFVCLFFFLNDASMMTLILKLVVQLMLLLLKKMYLHLFNEDICGELLILLFKNLSLNVQL